MGFSQRLMRAAALVEARLAALLDAAAADGAPHRLVEAMRLGALGGGKRLRPFLTLECAGLFGVSPEAALETAAALECVHCYSLVHDDLPAMDDDDLRRGKPTVHKAFDEWTAILAGDALLTLAFELLASPDGARRRPRAHGAHRRPRPRFGRRRHGRGTVPRPRGRQARRARAARPRPHRAPAGHEDGRAHPLCLRGRRHPRARRRRSARARWRSSASGWAAAFQIADDLLDVEGDAGVIGKATGKDARKATLVSLLGVPEARARLDLLEAQAIALLEPFGTDADILREATHFVARRQA